MRARGTDFDVEVTDSGYGQYVEVSNEDGDECMCGFETLPAMIAVLRKLNRQRKEGTLKVTD